MANVEQQKINCNGETFTRGTYNGINVLIRDKDGFINGTEFCNQFNKRFRKIFENHAWQAYLEAFKAEFYGSPNSGDLIYLLKKGYNSETQGTYVDPRIINYLAFWASPQYAVFVGKIMDSINDKVHEVLKDTFQSDTPENAKVALDIVVKDVISHDKGVKTVEQQLWGCRDNIRKLDAWEKEDYLRLKDEAEELRKKLEKVNSAIKDLVLLAE